MISGRRWLLLVLVPLYLSLLATGWLIGQWLPNLVAAHLDGSSETVVRNLIAITMLIFVLASALPFVPGAEIGFALIMLFGGKIALLIYLGMLSALSLAFVMGRFLPLTILGKIFSQIGFSAATKLILKLTPLSGTARLALLTQNAPSKLVPVMLRHRYLLLLLILNTPGNSLVGGGGGIAFIAGLSGLFSPLSFLLSIALAVAPVPLFFYLTL
ncbi:MAG: hypothetical protein MJK10_21600 [Pseudomonadales bacterium]|nr:hypothetical protein [Pseudomonadales bacterium]